jgi:hypothetical protein
MKRTIFTTAFWLAAGERMIRAFAAATLGAGVAGATDLAAVPWQGALSVGGVAAVVSLLISLSAGSLLNGGPALNASEVLDDNGRIR